MLSTTDVNPSAQLTYTITGLTHGKFTLVGTSGTAITSFTQQQVNAGQIQFIQDGGDVAPSYMVSVSDGILTTTSTASNVTFYAAPTLMTNQITLSGSQTIILTTNNINANAPGEIASQITFTITDLQHCHFEQISAPGIQITTFTLAEIQNSQIQFVLDGSNITPSYSIAVSDGIATTSPVAASIITPTPTPTPTLASSSISIGTIAGAIVGSAGGIAAVGGFLWNYYKGNQKINAMKRHNPFAAYLNEYLKIEGVDDFTEGLGKTYNDSILSGFNRHEINFGRFDDGQLKTFAWQVANLMIEYKGNSYNESNEIKYVECGCPVKCCKIYSNVKVSDISNFFGGGNEKFMRKVKNLATSGGQATVGVEQPMVSVTVSEIPVSSAMRVIPSV